MTEKNILLSLAENSPIYRSFLIFNAGQINASLSSRIYRFTLLEKFKKLFQIALALRLAQF